MTDTEFNLIDQPWVRVMEQDCSVREVSLRDAIVNAHAYQGLSGELPTQDIAVMRLILAVLHTVFSRVDAEGNTDDSDKDNDEWAEIRWKSLWERGCFSEKAIDDYFAKWHERFWLFHPERPFGQVAGLDDVEPDKSVYQAAKLNGAISQSGNKERLFSHCIGKNKAELSYSQAARWLLYVNAFDDNNVAKHRNKEASASKEKAGVGWLGKLGLIYLVGNNLFETLMLNFIMINQRIIQSEQKPVWEYDTVPTRENNEILLPKNLAELYSLQSRRIILQRKNDAVISYKILGGDFFGKENALFEPMTVWRLAKDKKTYLPKEHDPSQQMWREFATLYEGTENQRAGVVEWFRYLCENEIIDSSSPLRTAICSVVYGTQQCVVDNVFSDSLQMHSAILSDVGENFRNQIENEISKCGEVAKSIGKFAVNLYLASGGSDDPKNKSADKAKETAQAQLYYRLDMPFRTWLMGIDPDTMEDTTEAICQWRKTVKAIAMQYANEQATNASDDAVVGHSIPKTATSKAKYYSVPQALLIFKADLKRIYGKEENAS